MLDDIDFILSGIFGGILGASTVLLIGYFHFHNRFKNYFYNKEHFKTRMKVESLADEVSSLRIQVARLNAESYHAYTANE